MVELTSIRTAMIEDAASIARVHVETWRTTYAGIVPDEYLASLNEQQRMLRWREDLNSADQILVAERGREVVGFISGGAIHEPVAGYDAELYAIYLLVKCQRMGVGTMLLIELARRLDALGHQSMAVWLFEANAAARFYESSGAVRVGTKEREIAGVRLPLMAYGWPNLTSILALRPGR